MSTLEYQLTLPKKRMGAGALFFNEKDQLLLVEPSYKPTWEIPGGVVEAHESPQDCCQREIEEELGLKIKVGRLLCVDYNPTTETRLESLMFIFDGGVLTDELIAQINLQPDELLSYRFFDQNSLPDNLSPTLGERILSAWEQRKGTLPNNAYFENGVSL